MSGFRDLNVYIEARNLVVRVYALLKKFPTDLTGFIIVSMSASKPSTISCSFAPTTVVITSIAVWIIQNAIMNTVNTKEVGVTLFAVLNTPYAAIAKVYALIKSLLRLKIFLPIF